MHNYSQCERMYKERRGDRAEGEQQKYCQAMVGQVESKVAA